jgi:DNA-binding transcriptional regulator YhcF (GntR family)
MSVGPLFSVFGSPVAKVLDQAMLVGNMEQTISILADSTGLHFKTVKGVVDQLVTKGFMEKTRRIGNAQAYKFKVENDLHELIEWATKYQHAENSR